MSLRSIFLVASLFPFVSPCPVATDVQPIAGILAFLVLVKRGHLELKYLFLLLLSFFLIFYINMSDGISDIMIAKPLSLLFGLLVFVAFIYSKERLTSSLFSWTVSIYFLISVLTMIAPGEFIQLQGYIVRSVNVVDIYGARGISTFCTEPGLFGGLLIAFLIINDYLFRTQTQTVLQYLCNFIMILAMIVATKSGTGYLLFGVYLLFHVLSVYGFYLKASACVFIVFLLALMLAIDFPYEKYRGFSVLMRLSEDPMLFFEQDLSVLTRVVGVFVGFVSILEHPFGVGVNGVSKEILALINNYSFLKEFPKFSNLEGGRLTLASSFATMTVMYGVIWISIFYVTFFRLSKTTHAAKFFALVFIFVSYSAAFPLTWILLSLKPSDESEKVETIGEAEGDAG